MKERLGWIDIAKGICLIAVILGHMGIEQLGFVYSFHLTTFFILSGYTLKKVDLSAEYISQKFSRLMTPYFITCFAVICMDVINSIVLQKAVSTQAITEVLYKGVVKTFFASGGTFNFGAIEIGKGIGAIWFLPAMFFALIFIQLILRLQSKAAQLSAALMLFVLAVVLSKGVWLPFSVLSAMFSVPFILIGKWIKEYELLEKFKIRHYLIFFLAFIIGCYFGVSQVFYMVGCNAKDLLFTPVCAICSSLCIIGLSKLIKHLPPIEYIGKNSLIFLCVHLFGMNTISPYFRILRDTLKIPHTFLPRFIMDMLFILVVGFIIIKLPSLTKHSELKAGSRDLSIDILRAFLIILMIMGHVPINEGFRRFVYSFHMMAFVMVSGYFYKSGIPILENLKKTFKALSHYAIFAVLYLFVSSADFPTRIKVLILGVSYTKDILTDVNTVGPVYFILLLFAIRLIYVFVDLIRNEWIKNFAVLAILTIGILLGNHGYWLPWTFDGACVSLIFYHIAHYIRKYDLLRKSSKLSAIYFPLSCVWAYLIYSGGMEIAVRKYGNIGVMVAGGIAAFFISYLLCHYLANNLPHWISVSLAWIGQSTAYILILHTLFGVKIQHFAVNTLNLISTNIFHLGVTVIIQVALGTACCLVITYGKKLLFRPKSKAI